MDDALKTLIERDRVIGTIVSLFVSTDSRDWEAVGRCFADEVEFDMTSLAGGEPARLTPAEIVATWDEGLRAIDQIHHQAGNFRVQVRGDEAEASCYGIALHYRRRDDGRNTRAFVGSYDFRFARRDDGWKITLFRFNSKFLDGNLDLEG